MEQYTSEDARRDWRRILDRVQRGERVGVTRYGDPLAVMVPKEWHDRAEAALKKLEKPQGHGKDADHG